MRPVARKLPLLLLVACTGVVHAEEVNLLGNDVSVAYDSAQFLLPAPSALNPADFEQYARSEGSGDLVSVNSSTGFTFRLTNPNVHLVGLTMVQSGSYDLRGSASFVSAEGLFTAAGLGAPGAVAEAGFASALAPIRDGQMHDWTDFASLSLRGSAWSDVRALTISMKTTVGAAAPDADGDFAYIDAYTGAREAIASTESGSGTSTSGSGSGFPVTTPLPASAWLFASGLLALAGWRYRRD